jgi:hypothetical protein
MRSNETAQPTESGAAPTESGGPPAAGRAPAAPGGTPAAPGRADRPAGLRALRQSPHRLTGSLAKVPQSWRLPLATYLACQAILLFWWAAFYPGLMNKDSIIYIMHVTTGPWVGDNSVLYDSLVWLSLHVTGDLGALTLAQTVAMSAALAYTVYAFRRLGVPGRWTAIAAVILVALPPTGTFVIFIWKDVPFSICAYLVVPTLAHLLSLRTLPDWRRDPRVNRMVGAIGLELLGACLFRQDGFVIVGLATAGMVLLIAGIRIRLATVAVAAICVTAVLNLFVFPAVGIQRPPKSLLFGPANADLAVAYAEAPYTFTSADLKLMARVAPLAEWKSSANCYTSNPTTFLPGFPAKSQKLAGPLFRLWLQVLKRTPQLIIGARICRGSIAWLIFPGTPSAQTGDYLSVVPSDVFGTVNLPDVQTNPYRADMATRPLLGGTFGNQAATFLRLASETPQLSWLLWRGATWCYFAYLAVGAFALRRKDRALLAMAAIVAAQQLMVLADNPSQVFRYMAAPLLIGPMLVPVFCARNRRPAEAYARDQAGTSADPAALTGARGT